MGLPVASAASRVVGVDIHVVLVPTPGGPAPTPLPHPFFGPIDGGLNQTVKVAGKPVAVVGSTATNAPAHVPTPPGTAFQRPPSNRGTVVAGSTRVLVGGKGVARVGDPVATCNDPADAPVGVVVAAGPVMAS